MLAVGVFMFWGAGHYTVYDDEAFSCRRYVMPFDEMLRALRNGAEPDPPLYYLLMNGWTRVFGVGPVALRSLSILLFLLSLPFVRAAGEAWFDRRIGRAAMVLCALHPAHLFFGFAARWYSLMFLLVAMLLWLTARLAGVDRARDSEPAAGTPPADHSTPSHQAEPEGFWVCALLIIAWSLAAAAACYTNYFGPVAVALMWIVGLLCSRRQRGGALRWIVAGLIAVALFANWIPPFVDQITGFPAAEASWRAFAATAGRTTLALLTGDLASIQAWWVLAPMAIFGAGLIVLLIIHWRGVWPVAVIVLGCFAAGVASRTMIDKYVMSFSGPACVLAAALLVRSRESSRPGAAAGGARSPDLRRDRTGARDRGSETCPRCAWACRPSRIGAVTLVCLVLGWLGCGVNLVTQRHWSSLRWLDPFEQVTTELWEGEAGESSPPTAQIITSHPSARYYLAALQADRRYKRLSSLDGLLGWRASLVTEPADWHRAFLEQENTTWWNPTITPECALAQSVGKGSWPGVFITLQTAGFATLPDWEALEAQLGLRYRLTREHTYLEDPEAASKDRLDPNVKHPRWRITVRQWEKKR